MPADDAATQLALNVLPLLSSLPSLPSATTLSKPKRTMLQAALTLALLAMAWRALLSRAKAHVTTGWLNHASTLLTTLTRRLEWRVRGLRQNKREFVLPTTPSARAFSTRLRGQDVHFFQLMDVSVVYAFKGDIDFGALKAALERTLDAYPLAASRIREGADGYFEATNVDSAGAVLELCVAPANDCMPAADAPTDAWTRFTEGVYAFDREPIERPLLRARLTKFAGGAGGCVLAVALSHCIADGQSFAEFMERWSRETGGVPAVHVGLNATSAAAVVSPNGSSSSLPTLMTGVSSTSSLASMSSFASATPTPTPTAKETALITNGGSAATASLASMPMDLAWLALPSSPEPPKSTTTTRRPTENNNKTTPVVTPVCDHRVPPALAERGRKFVSQDDVDEGFLTPLDVVGFIPGFVTSLLTDEVADFVISTKAYADLKNRTSTAFPQGKWASSYECFMAHILRALAIVDGHPDSVRGRVVVNLRGRSELIPAGYFGCGLAIHDFDVRGQTTPDLALAFHDSLRAGLEQTHRLEKYIHLPDALEVAKADAGMLQRMRTLNVWAKCVTHREPVVNSWLGFDALGVGVDFGTGANAELFRVPSAFGFRRHIHLSVRSADELQLRMKLPPAEMAVFRDALGVVGLTSSVLREVRVRESLS